MPEDGDFTDEQLELLAVPEGDKWTDETLGPKHTARRLKSREPVKYAILKRALEDGAAITTLARSHKVGVNTLYAIIEADLGGLDAYHQSLQGKFKKLINLGLDRAAELLPAEKNLVPVMMAVGVSADKLMALQGLPTSIVEVRHTVNTAEMDRFNEQLRELRARKVEGRVIEEPPAIEGGQAA